MTLFNFNTFSDINDWTIIDDVVMGGESNGKFSLSKNGHGKFSGKVSLENNGGFSSLHYKFNTLKTSSFSKFIIKIKGDGKDYQFRVKDKQSNNHSYKYKFSTNEKWQTIEIPFSKMSATYRGKSLDLPNFEGQQIEEVSFLISNKKAENFKLLIDSISLE